MKNETTMTTEDTLLKNITTLCDYLDLMVTNGIDINPAELQDKPGVKMNPEDPEATRRAADRALAILLENGIYVGN